MNFASAQGEFFLALNPDVRLAPDYLRNLLGAMSRDPGLGAAVGRLLAPGPERLLDSAGIVPTVGRTRFVDRGRLDAPPRISGRKRMYSARAVLQRSIAAPRCATSAPPAKRPSLSGFSCTTKTSTWRGACAMRTGGHATSLRRRLCIERGGSGAGSQFVEYHLVRNRLWLTLRNARGRELLREVPGLAVFQAAKLIQSVRRPHVRAALRDQLRGVRDSLRERAARSWEVSVAKLCGGRS